MALPHQARMYEVWAPFIGRVLFGGLFLMGAAFKIPGTAGFAMEVAMTASKGLPYASIFVALAFVLEVVASLALIFGYRARVAGFVLVVFTAALTSIFHSDLSSPENIGQFVSHLGLIAGLLYISVYGAKSIALKRD